MRIRAYATLRDLLGTGNLDRRLEAPATVGQVLRLLAADQPALAGKLWNADGSLADYVTVLLNGRSVAYLQGETTPVTDADGLSLFPPVGGG